MTHFIVSESEYFYTKKMTKSNSFELTPIFKENEVAIGKV